MSFGAGSGILYLVAAGGEPAAAKVAANPAIVLISVLGGNLRRMPSSTSSRPWHRYGP